MDTCGHPNCSGPKVCEHPGCDVEHPNGCGADPSLHGWTCFSHTPCAHCGWLGASNLVRVMVRDFYVCPVCKNRLLDFLEEHQRKTEVTGG